MSDSIKYDNFQIASTTEFDKVWAKLKAARDPDSKAAVDKTYQIIDDLLSRVDMVQKYGAHHPGDTDVWDIHIWPKGRTTGDLILLYRINYQLIELDLRLQNITGHDTLDKLSSVRYANRQSLNNFDVIEDKFTEAQLNYATNCYDALISDYRVFQLKGQEKHNIIKDFIVNYFNSHDCPDTLTIDQLTQLLYHEESKRKKGIFSTIDLNSSAQETQPITDIEAQYIMDIFNSYNVHIKDAYIETEIDKYGDKYEDMYVVVELDDAYTHQRLQTQLNRLKSLYGIQYESYPNGAGSWGTTYDFYHYFINK